MLPRFVIVPALPIISSDSFQSGTHVYTSLPSSGFDIYDNQNKLRLRPSYPGRMAADAACAKMNMESLHCGDALSAPQT